jgi:alginate O-acetyltransferase complex protein AlgI
MLLVGLWHGAGWTFVVWGGLHGIYLVINHQWNRLNLHMPNSISKVLTFFCVVVAWVIFRADSIADAEKIIFAMFNFSNIALPFGGWYEAHLQFLKAYGVKFFAIYEEFSSSIAETIILSLILWNITNPCNIAFTMKPSLKYALLGAALFILGIILLGINGAGEFLYFQF